MGGRGEAEVARMLEHSPDNTSKRARVDLEEFPSLDLALMERQIALLRTAGLPE